ncbi:spermatogenesis-associated protein 4 [Ambystoma mexicanum]|uniref:spermatogenesis-associated protein 4 n=1 Tax=Ambystoma mexicanum TaxID=8296 RepID=UPI0037E78263
MSSPSSFPQAPRRAGLPREVLRWLQSLDLTFPLKNVRRDFSNGLLIAEIFFWYFQEDIQMHSYENGTSIENKLGNWSQLERFFMKRDIKISRELIDGTIHCKPGAAELLLQTIYVTLTNRRIKTIQEHDIDFTDRPYQEMLPLVARSTATKAVKNNVTLSEILIEPDVVINKQKMQSVINIHLQQRKQERLEDPERFNLKPTLGELAVRLPPPPVPIEDKKILQYTKSLSEDLSDSPSRSKTSVSFKEIRVKQAEKDNHNVLFQPRSTTPSSN